MTTITTKSTEGGLVITSNDGPVLTIKASNPENNQPVLRINQAGTKQHGGAASIRIDDPNPDIEFVETGLRNPSDPGAGKFEIAVQADQLQINGRSAETGSTKGFDTIAVFTRPETGGNIGIGFKEAKNFKKFGGGKGVIAIANVSLPPTKNLAGAGILYVDDGALKYRSPNGFVTIIAKAEEGVEDE
jgi:hypothetical protein